MNTEPLMACSSDELRFRVQTLFQRAQAEYEPYAVASNYAFTERDTIDSLQVSAVAGARTITLPPPTGKRRRRVIKTDSSANAVTLTAGGTVLINGATTVVLSNQYEFVTVEPTDTSWLIVGRGTLTPSFNSITFPAVQVPSADPNTLDDYEEGTWVPSVGGNATYTQQQGFYTKIGRVVHIHAILQINVLGTGSASIVSGLPFAAGQRLGGIVGFWSSAAASYTSLSVFTTAASSNLDFFGPTAATATVTSASPLQNGTLLYFSLTYYV